VEICETAFFEEDVGLVKQYDLKKSAE